jgi:hypothetical protein
MKKVFLLVVTLALSSSSAYGQAKIPPQCIIRNEAPGFCCWAAIETAARAQEITKLYNLKESRKTDPDGYIERAVKDKYSGTLQIVDNYFVPRYGGTIDSVLAKFTELGYFSYHYQRMGNYSKDLIYNALRKGHGAVVQVNWQDAMGEGCHAILLTNIQPDYVTFVNSNSGREEVRSLAWFEENWDGFVIILD